ncbi:hemopexin [Esox lucius]|uniref:Thyroglobulin type-1 domain-containing protein n=1 Tax=Esox lucius TaxID=8010 RepID=A0A3P8YF15_ESOLU|nr:hemopexin [Esox lucius]
MRLLSQTLCLCLVLAVCHTAPPNLDVMLKDQPENHKPCHQHKDKVKGKSPGGQPMPGAFVPQCNEHGHYEPLQCHGSTGHCWCVDSRGEERAGTRKGPGSGKPNCDVPDQPENHKPCWQYKDKVKGKSPGGQPMAGAFVPQCNEHGHYEPLQCHGSTGHCWCVDSLGEERGGTRKGPECGKPNCDVQGNVTEDTRRESCSQAPLDAVTSVNHNKTLAFRGDNYMQIDQQSCDGWRAFPIVDSFKDLHGNVTAAFSYTGQLHLIKGEQVFVYTYNGEQFELVEGFPKPLKDELGINGPLDAAFVCGEESVLHVIKGKQMFDVELTATPRGVVGEVPLPFHKLDAATCSLKGITVFVGPEHFKYTSPMNLAFSRISPIPHKTSLKMFGCSH